MLHEPRNDRKTSPRLLRWINRHPAAVVVIVVVAAAAAAVIVG